MFARDRYPVHKDVALDYDFISSLDNINYRAVCLTDQQASILKSVLVMAYWKTRWDNLTLDDLELHQLIAEIDWRLNPEEDCMGCVTCLTNTIETINFISDQTTIIYTDNDTFISSGGTTVNSMVSNNVKYGVGHDDYTDAQICFMAGMFVRSFAQAVLQADLSQNKSETEQTQDVINLTSIAFAGIALAVPALSIAVGLSVVVMAAAGIAIGIYANGTIDSDIRDALQDDEALEMIACCMFKRLSTPATIASWSYWRTLWTSQCPATGEPALTDNAKILRDFYYATVAQSQDAYIQFYEFMDDNNWLADAAAIPQCPCTKCANLTVYHNEDDVNNYTTWTVLSTSTWSDEELSGVFFGRVTGLKVQYDFGETVCLDELTLFMRHGSQLWRIFLQTDNPDYPIIQFDSAATAGSFLDNEVPLEGSVVCRKLTLWTRERTEDNIYLNPILGAEAGVDLDLVRMSVLRFYTAT